MLKSALRGIEMTKTETQLKSALRGIEIFYYYYAIVLKSWLKSALRGIEIRISPYVLLCVSLWLKSALRGIEMIHRGFSEVLSVIVKISP